MSTDSHPPIPTLPEVRPLSRRERNQIQFVDLALAIPEVPADEADALAFYARLLVQAALPHSDPGNVNVWGRTNGRFSLSIQPGVKWVDGQPRTAGLPFGSRPRLLMSWITTEAVRTKNRELSLGNTLSQFMEAVGVGPATGGRHGPITRPREHLSQWTCEP